MDRARVAFGSQQTLVCYNGTSTAQDSAPGFASPWRLYFIDRIATFPIIMPSHSADSPSLFGAGASGGINGISTAIALRL